jgi:hypothetical protein
MMSSGIALRTSNLTVRAITCDFECVIKVDHTPENAPDYRIEDYAKDRPFAYHEEEASDLAPYVHRWFSDPEDHVGGWLLRFSRAGRDARRARS